MSISLKQSPASSPSIKYSPTDQTLFLKSLHTQSENELNDVFQTLQNDKKADVMSLATFLKSLVPFVTSSEGLKNLMQLFIRNISDRMEDILKDESLTAEAQTLVKDFWSLCSIQQASFSLKPYYGQHDRLCCEIIPSLASLYIDLFIAVYGKMCESQKFSMRLYSWLMFDMNQRSIKTALLEVTQCSGQGAKLVLPLLRKLLVAPPDIKDHLDYLLHVVLLRRWSLVCKDLTDTVQVNLGLKAPKHFMDWLQPRWPQFNDHVPLDKGLKGRRVTELILSLDKGTINELIDVFAECLVTGEELSGNIVAVENKIQSESEPLFVIDKKGESVHKPETSIQKVPAKKRRKMSRQVEKSVEKEKEQITDTDVNDEETVLKHKVQKKARNDSSDGDDSKVTVTPVCMLDKTSSLYAVQKMENKILQGVEEMDVDNDENVEMGLVNEMGEESNQEEGKDRNEDYVKDKEENEQDCQSEDEGLKSEMGGGVSKEEEDESEDNVKDEDDNEDSQSEDEIGLENEMREDDKKEEDESEDHRKDEVNEDSQSEDEMELENEMREDDKEEDGSEDNVKDEEDNEDSQSEDEMGLENEMREDDKEEDRSDDDMNGEDDEDSQSDEIVDRSNDTGAGDVGYFIDRKADRRRDNVENALPSFAADTPDFTVNQKIKNSPKKIEKKPSSIEFGISYSVDKSGKQTSLKKSGDTFSTPRTEVIDGTEITIYDTSGDLAMPISKTPQEQEDMSTRKQFNNIIDQVDHQTFIGHGKDSVVQNSKEGDMLDKSEFSASEMPSSENVEHEVSRKLSEIRKSTEKAQVSQRLTRLRSKSEHEGDHKRLNTPRQSSRRKTLTGLKSPAESSDVRSISSENTLQYWLRKPVLSSMKQSKLQDENLNSSFNCDVSELTEDKDQACSTVNSQPTQTQSPLSSKGKSAHSPRRPRRSLKNEDSTSKTLSTMSETSSTEIPPEERSNETEFLRGKSVQSLKSTRQASKTAATSEVSSESMGSTGAAESDLQIATPRTPNQRKALSKMPYNLRETPVKKQAVKIDKVDMPEDNLVTLSLSAKARKGGTNSTPRKSPIVSPVNRRKSLRSSTKQN